MTLIIILIALAVEILVTNWESYRDQNWLQPVHNWFQTRYQGSDLWEQASGVLMVLAPVTLGALALQWLLDGRLQGVPSLLFAIAALWFSLGPKAIDHWLTEAVEAADAGDQERLAACAQQFDEITRQDDDAACHIARTSFVAAHERLYGVIFWFMLLGPAGALLYRQSILLIAAASEEQSGFSQAAQRLHWLLGWIPARMTAIAYSLTGSFDDGTRAWPAEQNPATEGNAALLIKVGQGAVRMPDDLSSDGANFLHTTRSLIRRSSIAWISLVALLSILGWIN